MVYARNVRKEKIKMEDYKFKYIYGPVFSWRLGSSLGIDPLAQEVKICSFNCVYCQLGEKGIMTLERKIYIPAEKIIEELKRLPDVKVDYITFSGTGEPTLAGNLEEIIDGIRAVRKEPLAILTNASLFSQEKVRKSLNKIDFVIAKLDACCQEVLEKVNRPVNGVDFAHIIEGIKKFRKNYQGRFGIQIMFVNQNKDSASAIAEILEEIRPDEVQLNTPLRPCGVEPLSVQDMEEIEICFRKFNVRMVYKAEHKKVSPLSDGDTLKRRGKI